MPPVRLARFLSEQPYPLSPPHDSNQLHQLDLVGPTYLKGRRQLYYIYVCKDAFDGVVCLKLVVDAVISMFVQDHVNRSSR